MTSPRGHSLLAKMELAHFATAIIVLRNVRKLTLTRICMQVYYHVVLPRILIKLNVSAIILCSVALISFCRLAHSASEPFIYKLHIEYYPVTLIS